MAKLTKAQVAIQNKVEELLKQDQLRWKEKEYILSNYNEAANVVNSKYGAFFTPLYLASDATLNFGNDYSGITILDLCAGIGTMSFYIPKAKNHVAVELIEDYYLIGKKLNPDIKWIKGDIFALDLLALNNGKKYDYVISNPPFGNIPISNENYKGYGGFEFAAIKLASEIANYGIFILPKQSAPFKFSGEPYYKLQSDGKYQKFYEKTGITGDAHIGIDTSIYKDCWTNTKIITEVVEFDFNDK